ncbi:MAG: DUF4340 domain-containing protein [Terriglobales bacterium]
MKSWMRLLIAVVILIVVIAVLYWPQKPKTVAAAKPLVTLHQDQVNHIAISQPGLPQVVLTKSASGWKLEQPYAFAADGPTVDSLLNALGDITGATDVGASSNAAAFGLDKPSTVELGLSNGQTLDFEFGANTPTGGNAYLRLGASGPVEMAPSDVRDNALKSAFDLQDKTVIQFADGQLTALDLTSGAKKLHLDRINNAWPKDQQSDAQSLIDALQDGQMTALPDPTGQDAAKEGLAHPAITVKLSWKGGSSELDLGAKQGAAQYFARNSSSPAIFTLSDYLVTDINNLLTPPKPLTVAPAKTPK